MAAGSWRGSRKIRKPAPTADDQVGVYLQRYSATGATVGGEVHVNSYLPSTQSNPSVAALSTGGWVVTWSSFGQDDTSGSETPSLGLYQQAYNANGTALGNENQINIAHLLGQQNAQIAPLTGGGWVVTWSSQEDNLTPFGEFHLYQRRYDVSGAPSTNEIAVGAGLDDEQSIAKVAALEGGGWVITWYKAGIGSDVYIEAFTSSGQTLLGTTLVNTYVNSSQSDMEVTALEGGGWVVTWSSTVQDGDQGGIYQQAYNANGTLAGVETRVNSTTAGAQNQPIIAALDGGGWVVAWEQPDNLPNHASLFVQAYSAAGGKVGNETLVSGGQGIPPHPADQGARGRRLGSSSTMAGTMATTTSTRRCSTPMATSSRSPASTPPPPAPSRPGNWLP